MGEPLADSRRVREIAYMAAGVGAGEVMRDAPGVVLPTERIKQAVDLLFWHLDLGAAPPLSDDVLDALIAVVVHATQIAGWLQAGDERDRAEAAKLMATIERARRAAGMPDE